MPRPCLRGSSSAILLAAFALVAGCASEPLGPKPETVRVVIENPNGGSFRIVSRHDGRELVVAGEVYAPTWDATLVSGPYVLEYEIADDRRFEFPEDDYVSPEARSGLVRSGGFSRQGFTMPVPALEQALRGRTLRIRIPEMQHENPRWRWIPAGPALVGDALGIGQPDERPPQIVQVADFWMARFETTNAQYAEFLNAAGDAVRDEWLAFDSRKCRVKRDDPTRRWVSDAPRLPVVTVSLAGALAYCEWLTATTGVRHRLPTEIEWEKAARGPASSIYSYGDSYQRFAANQESGALREAGGYQPNGWGLHDLSGNAFEWTADAYVADAWLLLEPAERRDGTRPAAPPGRGAEFQTLRGGSYVLDGMYLRNSFRMKQRPGTRTDDFGFRVVRDAPPERGRP